MDQEKKLPYAIELIIEGLVSVIFQNRLNELPCLTGLNRLYFGATVLDKFKEKGGIHECLLRVIRRSIFKTASCGEEYYSWVESGDGLPKKVDFPACAEKILANISEYIERNSTMTDNQLSAACTSA